MSELLSIIGFSISIVAIWISLNVARKQNIIALFQNRVNVLKALEEYFTSPKGYPNAIANFLQPSVKIPTENIWDPEIDELVGKATLLFSKNICDNLLQIKNDYKKVRSLDGKLKAFLSIVKEIPNNEEIELKFRDYFENPNPNIDEENQFREFCNKHCLPIDETTDTGELTTEYYNFYDLNKNQSDIFNSICKIQSDILNAMRAEIKPI